jgi:hypothetical protein
MAGGFALPGEERAGDPWPVAGPVSGVSPADRATLARMSVAEPDGPEVYWLGGMGRWVVNSLELAPRIAHTHGNVRAAIRKAAGSPGLEGEFRGFRCRGRGTAPRRFVAIGAAGLAAVFRHLHNVPGCRDIRGVLDEYLRLIAAREAARSEGTGRPDAPVAEPPPGGGLYDGWRTLCAERRPGKWLQAYRDAEGPAEPAPDEEIRPPDPEPANLFDPVAVPADAPPSWRINAAVLTLRRSGLPRYLFDDLDRWNTERCAALYAAARSWTEAETIFATEDPT